MNEVLPHLCSVTQIIEIFELSLLNIWSEVQHSVQDGKINVERGLFIK
jgi:hypothetical protein